MVGFLFQLVELYYHTLDHAHRQNKVNARYFEKYQNNDFPSSPILNLVPLSSMEPDFQPYMQLYLIKCKMSAVTVQTKKR